jgi:hypothetical protein
VPYGCFFHVESSKIPHYLDIYVNLGCLWYIIASHHLETGSPWTSLCPCDLYISFSL